jgi:hypothetical protein
VALVWQTDFKRRMRAMITGRSGTEKERT